MSVKTQVVTDVPKSRLADNLLSLWIDLHRYSFSALEDEFLAGKESQIENVIKLKIQGLLGGGVFELCRRVKQAYGKSLSLSSSPTDRSLSKVESSSALLQAINESSDSQMFHMMGVSISGFSRLMKKIRTQACSERNPAIRKMLWQSHGRVRKGYWKLLDSWVMRDMPNTCRIQPHGVLSANRLAEVLVAEYKVICRMAASKDLPEKYGHKLSQLSGLTIFQGLREQENGKLGIGTSAIAEWLIRPKSRNSRGLLADFSIALHEFAGMQKMLRIALQNPADFSKDSFKKIQSAEEVVEIFMHKILETGVLENIPS